MPENTLMFKDGTGDGARLPAPRPHTHSIGHNGVDVGVSCEALRNVK